MPSSPGYKRDYKQEYRTAKRRGENGTGSNSGDAKRKRARRKMEAAGRVRKGQDVDHKKPISKGGGNSMSNLRATSVKQNRSFARTPSGAIKKTRKKK